MTLERRWRQETRECRPLYVRELSPHGFFGRPLCKEEAGDIRCEKEATRSNGNGFQVNSFTHRLVAGGAEEVRPPVLPIAVMAPVVGGGGGDDASTGALASCAFSSCGWWMEGEG